MNEYDRDELLDVVSWIDDCLESVFEDNPDWVKEIPDSVEELVDTLKTVRERLKQATSGIELW